MKKYLFMIAAASVVLACAKENIQNDATPENEQTGISVDGDKISFVVDVESTSDVKATISSNTNFTWESTDRAAVYTSDGLYKVKLTPTEIDGGKAKFTGTVPSGKTVAEGAIVVYPYDFLSGPSTVTFPAAYTTKGQGTVLAAKVASGRKLTFKYLAATLKATITDVPSIASSITVTSTLALTGAYTINFSESNPALFPSSTANEITFSSPTNGNNELIIPVPTTEEAQTFTYNVNYSSNVLFTQSTTKTLARNTYMSLKDVSISPEIYLKGKISANTDANWDVDYSDSGVRDNEVKMAHSGTIYTTVVSLPEARRFRLLYRFPTGVFINMGPSTNGVYSGSNTLSVNNDSYLEATKGTYSLSFNSETSVLTVTQLKSNRTFYIISDKTDWAFDNSLPMVSCMNDSNTDDSERAFFVGVPYSGTDGFKIYDCSSWKNAIGASSISKNDNDVNWQIGTTSNNVYVSNPGHVYTIVHGNNAHSEFKKYDEGSEDDLKASYSTKVYLRGDFAGIGDKWSDGLEMSKVSPYNKLFFIDITVTGNSRWKVYNGTWYGFDGNVTYEGTAWDTNNDDGIGIYSGNWRIYFNVSTHQIKIFRLP